MRHRYLLPSLLLVLSLVILVLVGIGLFLWLDDASRIDLRMISLGPENASRRIQSEITLEFFVMSALFTYWNWMNDAEIAESFDSLFEFFPGILEKYLDATRFPDLIDAIFLVDRTGEGPPVSRFVDAQKRFIPDATALSDLLEDLGPDEQPLSYRIVAHSDALVLAIPIERNMSQAELKMATTKTTRTAHIGSLLIVLDRQYFAEHVVAELFAQYLGSAGGEYSFAVVDDKNEELLYSEPELTLQELDALVAQSADWIVPLTAWMGFEDSVLSDVLGGTLRGMLALAKGGSSMRIGDLYIRKWFALASSRSSKGSGEREPAAARPSVGADRSQGINLYIWHSAGTIRQAARQRRNRRLAVGYSVLSSFALIAFIYYVLYRRARNLRDREHEFVTSVTHELRTPVAAVNAAAENLAEGIVADPVRIAEYGKAILDHGRRLRALIDQVLLYAGLSGTGPSSRSDSIHLAELVDDVASRAGLMPQKRLIVHVQPDLPPYSGDSIVVETIISNLLSNAAKHAGQTVSVTLSVYRDAQAGRPQLVIRVSDTGRGIPKPELGRITAPFYRGEASRAQQTPGSGLGLSLVNRVVQTYNGTLSIDSEVDRGTIVTVRLPFREARTVES